MEPSWERWLSDPLWQEEILPYLQAEYERVMSLLRDVDIGGNPLQAVAYQAKAQALLDLAGRPEIALAEQAAERENEAMRVLEKEDPNVRRTPRGVLYRRG